MKALYDKDSVGKSAIRDTLKDKLPKREFSQCWSATFINCTLVSNFLQWRLLLRYIWHRNFAGLWNIFKLGTIQWISETRAASAVSIGERSD
jgi:hypothetical protein